MAVKVLIPTPLRQFTGKQPSIECNAATVGEALGTLTASFAELRKHLYTDDGRIRSFVNVYLNDEDIRFLDKENTRTKDGDTVSIVPSIAGGCLNSGGLQVEPAPDSGGLPFWIQGKQVEPAPVDHRRE